MAPKELIDDHVSEKQCKLAVNALLDHAVKVQEKKQETELLADKEQNVWLVITVKQMHPEKNLKPHRIPLAHPLVDPRTSSVCLITKDPQREYKDLLEKHGIRFISRVVGIEKLKGKFKPFEARRLLLKENELFLADDRVIRLLPGLLGKKFFQAKKQPIPVSLTKKDLKGELERAVSSTYFHQNLGTCTSVKLGTVSQTSAQVLANLKTALPAVVKNVKGGWDNVQSLHIKTNSSVSLPIWTCDLGTDEGGRWDSLIASLSDDEESDDDVSEDNDDLVIGEEDLKALQAEISGSQSTKGKKRAAEEDVEKPKKKAKAAADASGAPGKAKPSTKTADLPAASASGVSKKASSALQDSSSPASGKQPKKRKGGDPQGNALSTSTTAAQASSKVTSTSGPAEPATPKPVTKKKALRSSAADFFDEDGERLKATPAPPPNTPATALTGQTPVPGSSKRKAKAVPQTPVSGAIHKLAVGAEEAEPVVRKAATKDEANGEISEGAAAGKSKKKARKVAEPSIDAVSVPSEAANITALTTDELKGKKRSASALEKKKAKLSKDKSAAKSAKEGVLGKKRV